jgi:xylulokinase
MRDVWLGLDLGTSSVKCIAVDEVGRVLASAQERYPIDRPHAGWAEQDPDRWWHAVVSAAAGVRIALGGSAGVRAIGLAGQMHGLVLVDAAGRPMRPAIIWSDARATAQVESWRDSPGDDLVERLTGFRSASGMAALSLAWLRANEPDVLDGAAHALQPKDHVRMRLTGEAALDLTDAGASLLFDLDTGTPAPPLLEAAGIEADLLPRLRPTLDAAGALTAAAAEELGLPPGIPVATGGGDQAMAALALGISEPGRSAITLSSGGTVLVPTPRSSQVPAGYHRLAAAEEGVQLGMGVVLAAGIAVDWFAGVVGAQSSELLLAAADARMDPSLVAHADLGGTRTPTVDSRVQGAFAGLGFQHGREHLMRALVESVAISLADGLAALDAASGVRTTELVLSGGGARFAVWRQAVADAADMDVVRSSDLEHPALGAALAAMRADRATISVDPRVRVDGIVHPDGESADRLREIRRRRPTLTTASLPDGARDGTGRRKEENA